jgi:hypothetical protein
MLFEDRQTAFLLCKVNKGYQLCTVQSLNTRVVMMKGADEADDDVFVVGIIVVIITDGSQTGWVPRSIQSIGEETRYRS